MTKHLETAKHHVECTIERLKNNETQTEMESEKEVSHAKGFISSMRYANLLEHKEFKPMDKALDNALIAWHQERETSVDEWN